ncbi:hypothetical protein C4585_03385 [Candidatus Parcubacteria bacterium]|nr:MAG: hypothetical protein C4585_03385 [Candidatus Parcubacteria bacterium]
MAFSRVTWWRWIALFLFVLAIGWVLFPSKEEAEEMPTSQEMQVASATEPISNVRLFSNDLLPDLVPLPPRDMKVDTVDGKVLLYFSTTYFNQGLGTLELRADPATAGVRADIERDVLQRIYHQNGSHRDKKVGTFLWHQEHLHYHFTDFISYDLESLGDPTPENLSGLLVKSTFCLRDISRVLGLTIPNRVEEATYKICAKELQGVSVGWGDTYYWDYPAQNLDITELPSGTYKLTFIANPARNLEETRYDNNTSSAIFTIDVENETVEVLEEFPKDAPEVEHVHLEDPFGIQPPVPKEPALTDQ